MSRGDLQALRSAPDTALLSHGDHDGRTPLHVACAKGNGRRGSGQPNAKTIFELLNSTVTTTGAPHCTWPARKAAARGIAGAESDASSSRKATTEGHRGRPKTKASRRATETTNCTLTTKLHGLTPLQHSAAPSKI